MCSALGLEESKPSIHPRPHSKPRPEVQLFSAPTYHICGPGAFGFLLG